MRGLKEQKLRYTVLCGTSNKKIINYKIIRNSVNGKQFMDFIKDLVRQYEGQTKYVLLDNARIHHYKPLKEYLQTQTTIKLIYNDPYCPQYNPIEFVFNEFKNKIKKNAINKNNIKCKIMNALKINKNNLSAYFEKSLDNLKNYL